MSLEHLKIQSLSNFETGTTSHHSFWGYGLKDVLITALKNFKIEVMRFFVLEWWNFWHDGMCVLIISNFLITTNFICSVNAWEYLIFIKYCYFNKMQSCYKLTSFSIFAMEWILASLLFPIQGFYKA